MTNGFFVTMVGSGLSKIILVIATFLFARIMTQDDFGSFSYIRNTLNLIIGICALNYVGLATKFSAESEVQQRAVSHIALLFIFSLCVCLILSFLLLLVDEASINRFLRDSSVSSFFRTIGIFLPLFMIQPLAEGILRGYKLFKTIGFLQISTSLLFVVFVVTGFYLFSVKGAIYGLFLYYISYSIISISILIIHTDILKKLRILSCKELGKEAHIILTMVVPVFILSFVEAPITWYAQSLLVKYESMSSVGSMTAILQLRNLLIIIPTYYFSTFTTYQASYRARKNYSEYFLNYKKTFKLMLPASVLITILFILAGSFLLSLYGPSYCADLDSYIIAIIAFPLMILVSIYRVHMLIFERQIQSMLISILSSVLFLLLLTGGLRIGSKPITAYFYGQLGYYILALLSLFYYYNRDRSIKIYENS